MKSLNIKSLVLLLAGTVLQWSAVAQAVLDGYVQAGLESNLVLREKAVSLAQAEHSLRIARSYFLPSINLLGDYTHGDGGRRIDLPIGDMLNPVYASLNQLTQSDAFPQIENVSQTFFPQNFYDARIRTTVPLFNTDLITNRKAQAQQLLLKGYEVDVYRRELVLDIKTSYYNYLSALSAVRIYESALLLVQKNSEVNESLLRNGKALPATVLRSKSEIERVTADLNSAQTQVIAARKYFNFLLNRDLDTEIIVDDNLPVETGEPDESGSREEIQMLRTAIDLQETLRRGTELSRMPRLSAFVDLGSQASDWRLNGDSRYYLAGVQLSIPLFQGFRTNIESARSRLDVERSRLQFESTASRLQIASDIARENLRTSRQNLHAATEQQNASRSYFSLIEKGYQQGVYSLIEFIDARNQLTSAQIQLNVRQYEMLKAAAQLERETSSFKLPN